MTERHLGRSVQMQKRERKLYLFIYFIYHPSGSQGHSGWFTTNNKKQQSNKIANSDVNTSGSAVRATTASFHSDLHHSGLHSCHPPTLPAMASAAMACLKGIQAALCKDVDCSFPALKETAAIIFANGSQCPFVRPWLRRPLQWRQQWMAVAAMDGGGTR